MIKKLLFTAACAFGLLPAFAQHSLLYKISGKDLSQPSYLYGTIHMICPDDFIISDKLKNAMTSAKTLYLEMDMDDPVIMQDMMKGMQEKEGYKLENIFRPEDFIKLKTFMADSIGTDVNAFQQYKPMVLMSLVMMKALPCPMPSSYETTLMTMAKEQQKSVEGLENIADQMHVFDKMADTTEARMIMEYVNDMKKQREYFAKMVAAYKEQDVEKLHAFLKDSPDLAGYEDVMVYDRNRNWIPVIEKAAKKEATFFACGAMHLGGSQGVISLLRNQGYTVEPIL